ncbi:molybdenum ABC transporter ATP-binding protein [Thermocladium modestius]|uniref:Molybdate/tungstate import ATP-binding protein WtpC n=1 Tax=Thermocladium modestius TaxID=62609 RepID=A0A830H031_9CREN|nr:ABC transporter ATP-binding protein [Thermocladium modestius]GGP21928.1 molybdenum ABC transporter ATP-binding protein [Thermocladium modestius]
MSIRINDLTHSLQSFRLGPINLAIDGDYFVLIGPTGSGKSTLLRLIAGAFFPRGGTIIIDGVDVTHAPPERRNLSFVPQDYALFSIMSVRSNIEFGLKARGIPREERERRVSYIADKLGIRNLLDREPNTLSGGERQKVALARALAPNPRILLLDEPLSMLDSNSRMEFVELLKSIHREYNLTVIHVTHDFEEAYALADKVGVIMGGQMRYVGDKEFLFNSPPDIDVARFIGYRNNVVDGRIMGLDGILFIRPEWIEIGNFDSLRGTVTNVIDSLSGFYVEVTINGNKLVSLARSRPDLGAEVGVKILKYNVLPRIERGGASEGNA